MKPPTMGEVELPPHIKHGSHRAYNHYRCRCEKCRTFRLEYHREHDWRNGRGKAKP